MDKIVPKVSIITVVYNDEDYIEETIQNTLNQSYTNIEYIVIDGGSTDGTIDIIKKYDKQIDYWISEKDQGIYDAMNKGINLATGDWVNFMNAGDGFYKYDILEKIFKDKYSENVTLIYGDVQVDYKTFSKVKKAGNIDKLMYGMQFSHQSTFIKTKYHKEHKFNLKNKIGADFEFLYQAYMHNRDFFYTQLTVSKVSIGGLSDIKRIKAIYGCWKVVGFKKFKINLHYSVLLLTEMIKKIIKLFLGKSITAKITKNIYNHPKSN